MIIYCDTSALIKLYIEELHSEAVRGLTAEAGMVSACRIAWVEAHSAFARRARTNPDDISVLVAAKQAFVADWPRVLVLEITQPLVERAGDFAEAFSLRAYDCVQLAAAQVLAQQSGEPISFACFDVRPNAAARVLGMNVLSIAEG